MSPMRPLPPAQPPAPILVRRRSDRPAGAFAACLLLTGMAGSFLFAVSPAGAQDALAALAAPAPAAMNAAPFMTVPRMAAPRMAAEDVAAEDVAAEDGSATPARPGARMARGSAAGRASSPPLAETDPATSSDGSAAPPPAAAPAAPPENAATQPATPPSGAVALGTAALRVGEVVPHEALTTEALKALPSRSLTVTFQTGKGEERARYTGALLWEVLAGMAPDAGKHPELHRVVRVTARDGYVVLLSMGEIAPDFGDVPALLAYERDGAPLKAGIRLILPGDTRGARNVVDVTRLDILQLETDK